MRPTALFGGIVMLCLTALFGCAAVGLLAGLAPHFRREIARVERLPTVDAAELAQSPAGREVLLEARIGRDNPAPFRQFVAYEQEAYNGRRCEGNNDSCLDFERAVTPPLLLELPDGQIQLVGGGYAIKRPTVHWRDYDYSPGRDPATGEPSRRYAGFEAGNAVVVVGAVVMGPEGPAIAAEWVAGGTRAEYLASLRDPGAEVSRAGILCALGAVLLLGLCARVLWFVARAPATR